MSEREALPSLFNGLRRLFGHLSSSRQKQLVVLSSLMLIGALAEIMTLGAVLPFLAILADPERAASYPILQKTFSLLGWTNSQNIIIPVTILFALVAIVAALVRLYLMWATQRYVFDLGYDLAVEVYRRTLYQPYAFHVSKNTSELVAAFNKVQHVVGAMLLPAMQAVAAAVVAVFILSALLAIDAATAFAAAAAFGTFYIGVSYAARRRLRNNSRTIATVQSARIQTVQEGLGGIRDVLIDQVQEKYLQKFKLLDEKYRDAQAINAFVGGAPRYVVEAMGMVVIACLALALSSQKGGLVAALPALGALALGAQRLLPLLQLIYTGWAQLTASRQMLQDVLVFLDLPVDEQVPRLVETTSFKHSIEFDSVSFRYGPNLPDVLHDFNLRIERGARVGFIGRTGSGKSTLMDIAMGLLVPTSGQVLVDGRALSAGTLAGWRSNIAHVPQSIYLSDASIAENIAFGCSIDEISLQRVARAAEKADLGSFIKSLPDGYWTSVGERGTQLSGGQRQRIGIARALYKEATLLVFDEATSALDSETEATVMEAVRSLGRDLTILMIAHRLSTVESCDTIVRLENGRIISRGVPAEVFGDRSIKPSN